MTLLAAFEVLLHRYSGQDDFAVGSPIAGRVRKDTEGLVGYLANTLAMRADLAGNPTFREALRRVRETALAAFQHQEMPFERLVEELNPPRNTSRHPLFQVLFTLQNAPWPKVRLANLSISHVPLDSQTAKFDLWLSLRETDSGLQSEVEYNVALFDAATIGRMMGHFETLPRGDRGRRRSADRPVVHPYRAGAATNPRRVERHGQGTSTAPPACTNWSRPKSRESRGDRRRLRGQATHLCRVESSRQSTRPISGSLRCRRGHARGRLPGAIAGNGDHVARDPQSGRGLSCRWTRTILPERLGFMIADSRPAAIVTTRALAEAAARRRTRRWSTWTRSPMSLAAEDSGNLPSGARRWTTWPT